MEIIDTPKRQWKKTKKAEIARSNREKFAKKRIANLRLHFGNVKTQKLDDELQNPTESPPKDPRRLNPPKEAREKSKFVPASLITAHKAKENKQKLKRKRQKITGKARLKRLESKEKKCNFGKCT